MMRLLEGVLRRDTAVNKGPYSTDIGKVKAWLNALPLVNAPEANNALTEQLNVLAASQSLSPLRCLEILELLLPSAGFVQNEYAKKFAAKPLPLNPTEQQAFDDVCRLWQKLIQAYTGIMMGSLDADGKIKTLLPLICQRSISCSLDLIKEYYRAHKQIEGNLWHQINGYYEISEIRRFTDVEIVERPGAYHKVTTCKATYAEALLLDVASPYNMTLREFEMCVRWCKRWAHKLRLSLAPEDPEASGYAIDLFSENGPGHVKYMEVSDSLRYLGTARLSTSLMRYIKKLTQGENPIDLGLGEECSQPSCQELMEHLYKQWCTGRSDRRFERHQASHQVQVCMGFTSIYHFMSGKPFKQPEHVGPYSRKEMDTIHTFRQVVTPSDRFNQSNIMMATEVWDVLDQSATGFHLSRSGNGARLGHEQLVAIRPPDAANFLLCQVRRLKQDNQGMLDVGVELLPGVPHAVAVRGTGINLTNAQKYVPGFVIEANPAMKVEPSLIIPAGWFQHGRIIEIFTESVVRVTLGNLLARGADFDRVTFGPTK